MGVGSGDAVIVGLADGVASSVAVAEALGVEDSEAAAVGEIAAVGITLGVAIGAGTAIAGVCDRTSIRTSFPETSLQVC